MRTTLDLDGKLLHKAMAMAHTKTKTETIERALQELIRKAHMDRLIASCGSGTTLTLRKLSQMRRDE